MALRDNYSLLRTSDYAKRDPGRKGKLLEMLDDDAQVIVVDEGVGYKCEWAQVIVPTSAYTEAVYVKYKFLEPLDGTPASLEMIPSKKSLPDSSAWLINWDGQTPNKVYFDKQTAKWCIPVETQYTTTGGSELTNRMEEALYTGVEEILSYLDKKHSTDYIEELLSHFCFARAEDWYIDPRPKSHLRVLVTVPEKYVGGLDSVAARGKVTMGYSPDKEYEKSGSSFAASEVIYYQPFYSNQMRAIVKKAAKKLQQYQKDMNKSGYAVEPCINLTEQGDRIRACVGKLKTHMLENDRRFREESEDLVELGWDKDFNLVWIQYTESAPSYLRNLPTRGFKQLVKSDPFDDPTTMALLFFSEVISNVEYSNVPWMEFLNVFIKPEPPTVYPSDKANKCAGSVDVADAFEAETKTKNGKKSNTVKLKEDSEIMNNLGLKSAIVAGVKNRKDYTGDPVLQDLAATVAQIHDLDDAFRAILARIPIADLLLRLLACQQISLPSVEIDLSAIGDMMDNLSDLAGGIEDLFESVDALWEPELPKNFKIPKLSLPDEMPIADIMAGFKDMLVEMIKEMITQMFVEMVKGLLNGLVADCKDADNNTTDDFGGENIGDLLADNGANADDVADLLDAMGLTPDEVDDQAAQDEAGGQTEETPAAQIGGFLDDVSALLTPGELCALLNGNPPPYVVELVKSLIVNYRQEFSKLNSTTKIVAAFRAIGGLADSSLCDKLAEGSIGAPKLYLPSDRPLCDIDGSLRRLREDLLRDKGDDITDDQIEEMLDKVKDRKKKQAEQIQNLLEELEDGEFTAPPVFCVKNPDGTITPGLVDELPESVTYMMRKTIDTMFEPTYMAFNLDAQEWASPMIENTTVKQQVPTLVERKLKDEDGDMTNHWVPHPEVKRMMAQGIPEVAFLKKKADPFDLDHDDYINKYTDVDTQKKRCAPHVKDSLEGLEGNDAFTMKYDTSGSYYYEMILPPDPNAVNAMQGLQELDDIDFGDLDIDTSIFSQFQNALPNWSIEYHMPVAKPIVTEEDESEVIVGTIEGVREPLLESDASAAEVAEAVTPPDPSTYLDDEYIISVKMNGMPILHIENSVEMDYDRKKVIQDKVRSDFSTVIYSPQQEVFGEYVKHMWTSTVGSNPAMIEKYDSMSSYFKTTLFSQISKDLFSHVSREVAASAFFDVIESTVGSGDNKIWSWTPKVELVELNPDPTDAQRACGVDPHLLNLDCLKKKVMDDALAGLCDDDPPATDGKGSDKMSSIERAAMDACIRTTIRANLIDYFLRGVFAFSTFDVEAVLDAASLDMFAKLMETDIRAYSQNYYLRFMEQADLTYHNMVAEGYFEEEEAERQIKITSGEFNEFSHPTGWSMPYLIKEQVTDVAKDLQDLLGTTGNVTSVKNKWLSTYVPVFNTPSSQYDVRFSELNDDVVTADNYEVLGVNVDDDGTRSASDEYETGDAILDNESLITSKDGVSFDLTNGNFILERYVRVVEKGGLKQEWLDTARRYGEEVGSTTEFANTTGVVNPENFSQFMAQIIETDLRTEEERAENPREEARLNELYSEIKYGYRLTYIPPMSDQQMVEVPYVSSSLETDPSGTLVPSSDYSSVLSSQSFPVISNTLGAQNATYNFGALVETFSEEHHSAARENAAFAVYETFPAQKATLDTSALGTNTLEDTEIVRLITPVPLVSVEQDLDLSMLLGDVSDGSYFETSHPTYDLHQQIQEDEWFDVMFGYTFPLNRYMSMLTLYTITAVSNYDGVPLSFENTRDELHRLFWILLNGGDYTYEDDNMLCVGGSGGLSNASGKLASKLAKCFGLNFGFGLCLKGLGLGFVFKMMLMTPLLVFKFVVEFMDPNISIAVKLFSLGCLLGVAIPVPIISFGMLPMNIFLGMPGPPITPLGLIYLALGLGNLDLSASAGGGMDLGFELPNKAEEKGMSDDGGCLPEC